MYLYNPPTPRAPNRFKVTADAFEYVTTHGRVLILKEPGAPNLDASDPETLMGFWHAGYIGGWRLARFLFPERPRGYVSATGALIGYASNKASAMACRARGDIAGALAYERICECIYSDLPGFARW